MAGTCAYSSDPFSAACGTAWCEAHSHRLGGDLYCDRHHEVVVALNAAAGSLHEFRRPPVDDRTLSLTQLLFRELDGRVVDVLGRRSAGVPDATVAADQHLRAQFLEGRLTWERGWGVVRPQGYLSRVVIRVPVGEPPVVNVLVDRRPVFSGTPDWIAARLESREGFYQALAELIDQAVSRSLAEA